MSASYDDSSRRNLPDICQKCTQHYTEKDDFREFSKELFQFYFLKKEEVLDENERQILKTFFMNNQKNFLVVFQL